MTVPWDRLAVCTAVRLKAPTERLEKEKAPDASLFALNTRPSLRVLTWTTAFATPLPVEVRTVPVTLPRAFMKMSMFIC